MISLGELISHQPLAGGHIALAARYVDRSFSFAVGWVYWFTWVIALPAELAASAVIIQYWTDLDVAIWISMCYVVVLVRALLLMTTAGSPAAQGINFAGTRVFAECEYWFALLKYVFELSIVIPELTECATESSVRSPGLRTRGELTLAASCHRPDPLRHLDRRRREPDRRHGRLSLLA